MSLRSSDLKLIRSLQIRPDHGEPVQGGAVLLLRLSNSRSDLSRLHRDRVPVHLSHEHRICNRRIAHCSNWNRSSSQVIFRIFFYREFHLSCWLITPATKKEPKDNEAIEPLY